MTFTPSFSLRAVALAVGLLFGVTANAALFEDTDARRAILDLRERVERQGEEIKNFQRSLLEQQNQFEALRAETARLRGEKEELTQALRRQQELSQGVDDRLKKFEPTTVKVDGVSLWQILLKPRLMKMLYPSFAMVTLLRQPLLSMTSSNVTPRVAMCCPRCFG
jgi:hypothetical protein